MLVCASTPQLELVAAKFSRVACDASGERGPEQELGSSSYSSSNRSAPLMAGILSEREAECGEGAVQKTASHLFWVAPDVTLNCWGRAGSFACNIVALVRCYRGVVLCSAMACRW